MKNLFMCMYVTLMFKVTRSVLMPALRIMITLPRDHRLVLTPVALTPTQTETQ